MKILVLNASPKKKEESATMTITQKFLEGVNAEQQHSIDIIDVISKDIKYCQACLTCWIVQDGKCTMYEDDMNDILEKIIQSDMIVWSFPLYEYGIPAPLKTLIDRTNPLLKWKMYEEGDKVFHERVVDITKKKNVVICGCGFPYFEKNFMGLKIQMETFLINPSTIYINESPLVLSPNLKLEGLKKNLFLALKEAGKEYNQIGKISSTLLDKIQKPLLPNDVYINIINSMINNS